MPGMCLITDLTKMFFELSRSALQIEKEDGKRMRTRTKKNKL